MTQPPVAHELPDGESHGGVGYRRVTAWIGLAVVAFFPIGFGALTVANLISMEAREIVLGIGAVLWASGLVIALAVSGSVLNLLRGSNPGLESLIGYGLGTISIVGVAAAVRTAAGSDPGFELEHALPQLYVPTAMFFVATSGAGRRFARLPAARAGWNVVWAVGWILTAVLVGVTLSTSASAPGAILTTAIAAAYAVISGVMAVAARQHQGESELAT